MKTLIQINRLSKSYGPRVLFDSVNASLGDDRKIGVIGANGAGKSTLCRMMLREEGADSGQVIYTSDLRLGYLEQGDPFRDEETVLDFLRRHSGRPDWMCGKVAGRFELKFDLFDKTPISALSGGYRTRVKLAAMLLGDPNFLILDEPTNYLDLSTLILLEKFLLDFSGGFLIVSHDREFLKRTCEHTLEVEGGRLNMYPGGIEDYLEYKAAQAEQAVRANRNVEIRGRQLQNFIDRFGAKNTKAAQAKSKAKQLARLEKIQILNPIHRVRIRIPAVNVKRGPGLECENLAIGYPERKVADGISLRIDRGTRVAVVGDNGQGKTTFLRTLAGDLEPLGGRMRWSFGMELAYFAQHVYGELDGALDALSYLSSRAGAGVGTQDVLDMAGSFLFSGDEVRKPITVLSGGERSRLCLAGLLLGGRDVLILDEPTNHLDFETVETLGDALGRYEGTVFFTSHDRTFVNLVATAVACVECGTVRLHPGNYEDYVYHMESAAEEERQAQNRSASKAGEDSGSDAQSMPSGKRRKLRQAEIKKLTLAAGKAEKRIHKLEDEKTRLLAAVADPARPFSRRTHDELDATISRLEQEESGWFSICEEIEELKKTE